LQDEDCVEHILMQCTYSRMVWGGILQAAGLQVEEPQMDSTFESWWTRVRSQVPSGDRRKLDTLIILVARTLWKQRNARVFANLPQQFGTERIVGMIKEEFNLWMFAKFGGSYATTGE
jgi:hypothetical protein